MKKRHNQFNSKPPVRNGSKKGFSSNAVLNFEDAKTLSQDQLNGVEEVLFSGKMAILPGSFSDVAAAVGLLLDTRLFHYLPAAKGVLLAYSDLKISNHLANTSADSPFAHVVYAARAVVFRPRIGRRLRGVVSQLSSIKRCAICILCDVLNVQVPLDTDDADKNHQRFSYTTSSTTPRTSPFRVGDEITFELDEYTIAPNGTVSLSGRKCEASDGVDVKQEHQTNNSLQQQTTWSSNKQQIAQKLRFDSSSSSSSSSSDSDASSSSDSETSSSFSEAFDNKLSSKSLGSSVKSEAGRNNKRKHLGQDIQNGCVAPCLVVPEKRNEGNGTGSTSFSILGNNTPSYLLKSPSKTVDSLKLEPQTPNSHLAPANNEAAMKLHLHYQQKQQQQECRNRSTKKKKYLAD